MKRKRSFWVRPAGRGFAEACWRAGRLAVLGQRSGALALIKAALSKYKGRAQQYQLLCQGGDCLLALGKFEDADKVFRQALEASYEPAGARARIGLAKCMVSRNEHAKAEEEIARAIDEAGKAAKEGYSSEGNGEWTLLAVPLCPQAIAMRIYRSFRESGHGRVGRKLLDRARRRAVGEPYRLEVFRGKVDERRGRAEEAAKKYSAALSGVSLGPRALAALGGWCRCERTVDSSSLRQKLSGFRGKLSDRAILVAILNLRLSGRASWLEAVETNLDGQDGVACASILPIRIMSLGNRKKWGAMREAAERLLNIDGLTPQEGAGAVAAAVEAEWLRGGKTEDLEKLVSRAPDKAKARWAAYRRLLYLGDGEACESFFRSMGLRAAARASLGEALLQQGKREEARKIFSKLGAEEASPRCRTAAISSLLATVPRGEEIPGEMAEMIRSYGDELERRGEVAALAGLVVSLRRGRRGGGLEEEILTRARGAFDQAFFGSTEPRKALAILNSMNMALLSFGGKGGVRDLYLSTAAGCLPMLGQGGSAFHRYMVSVYKDTYSLGLVSEADRLWDEVRSLGPVADQWKAARMLVEAETRVRNRQASGIDLAGRSYSTFGTGEFASRACYLLALERLGNGRNPRGWAAAGLDALGRTRTAEGNLGLVARLEVLAAGVDRRNLGRLELKWRRHMSFRRVAERVVSDLFMVETPNST